MRRNDEQGGDGAVVLSSRPGAQKACAGQSRVAAFGMTRVFLRLTWRLKPPPPKEKSKEPASEGGRCKIREGSRCSLAGPFEAEDKLKPGRYMSRARAVPRGIAFLLFAHDRAEMQQAFFRAEVRFALRLSVAALRRFGGDRG